MSAMTKHLFALTVIAGFTFWPIGCGPSEQDSGGTQNPAANPPAIQHDGVDEARPAPTDGQTQDDDTYVM